MANSKIVCYPVGNGDMTLVKLNDINNTTILIDMNVRKASHDDNEEECYDVMTHLRDELNTDTEGRYYIDAFILTHADKDHISGLEDNFYLDSIDNYKEKDLENELIVINEMWSTRRFSKRSSDDHKLCPDAKAFNKEMKRRVNLFKDTQDIQKEGDRAIVIANKDDDIENMEDITYTLDTTITMVNQRSLNNLKITPIGPLEQQDEESDDDFNSNDKNRGSMVFQMIVTQGSTDTKLLFTGDATAEIWEYYNGMYKDLLEYDVLHLAHHCSWYSIGRKDSETSEYIKSEPALNALSHAVDKNTAIMISSSKEILDDENNPPHYNAKQEYLNLIDDKENFLCTQENIKDESVEPIVIEITAFGTQVMKNPSVSKFATGAAATSSQRHEHGQVK